MTDSARSGMDGQQAVSFAMRYLVEHPDAPLTERVSCATVLACGGDVRASCTLEDVAHYANCEPGEVMQALLAVREQKEAADA